MRITKKRIKLHILGNQVAIEKEFIAILAATYLLSVISLARKLFTYYSYSDPFAWLNVLFFAIFPAIALFYAFLWLYRLLVFFKPEFELMIALLGKLVETIEKAVGKKRRIPKPTGAVVAFIAFLMVLVLLVVLFGVAVGLLVRVFLIEPSNMTEYVLLFALLSVAFFLFDRLGRKIGWRKSH